MDQGGGGGGGVSAAKEKALTAVRRLAQAANALNLLPRDALNAQQRAQAATAAGEQDVDIRADGFDLQAIHEDQHIVDGEGGVFIDAEALLPDDGAGFYRRRDSIFLAAADSFATTHDGEDEEADDDEEDKDEVYVEDKFARDRNKEKKYTNHSGYIYIKVKTSLLPFMYRRYYCVLRKGAGPRRDDTGASGAASIQYWRSRLACHRLMFNPRVCLELRPSSYTTDIVRVRGLKIDLRGGEDFARSGSDRHDDLSSHSHHAGRRYLASSLLAMQGSSVLSRFTGLKWFQFRAGQDLHAFTVQVDGETSPFKRHYVNQVTFASESLPRLMRWRRAITEAILTMRESQVLDDDYGDDDMFGKCHDRCMQATCSAMHLMPTTVLMHALVSKRSQHLKITLPPAFSPVHYFVHAVVCSIAYTTCCAEEVADEGGDHYFPRHSLWDFAVIDKGIPAEYADLFLTDWFYDDEFDAPRLVVYYKVIRKEKEMAAKTGRVAESPKARGNGDAAPDTDGGASAAAGEEASYLHVIFGIRGTEPSDPEDLSDDLLILRGAFTARSKRCRYFKRKLKDVREKYQRIIDTRDADSLDGLRGKAVPRSMKITVTGHSLGGLVAYMVGNDDECYIYNMASSMFQGVERKGITKSSSVQEHVRETAGITASKLEEEFRANVNPMAAFFQRVATFRDWHLFEPSNGIHGNGAAHDTDEEEEQHSASSPDSSASPPPSASRRAKVSHFAPFSDDIAANARIGTHWIPQYVAGHPHILPNHFRHAIRLITEMRRVAMIDTEYLRPKNLMRAKALPITKRSVEDLTNTAKEAVGIGGVIQDKITSSL